MGGVVGGNLKKGFEVTKIKLVSSKTVNEPEKRPHRDLGLIECVNRVFLDQVRNLCVFKSVLILYVERFYYFIQRDLRLSPLGE